MAKLNTAQYYLYCITNKKNKKKYIGITNNPVTRWEFHQATAESGDKRSLYQDIREYGKEEFMFSILACAPLWSIVHLEIAMIAHWNTRYPGGYNNSPGGETGRKRRTRKKK